MSESGHGNMICGNKATTRAILHSSDPLIQWCPAAGEVNAMLLACEAGWSPAWMRKSHLSSIKKKKSKNYVLIWTGILEKLF